MGWTAAGSWVLIFSEQANASPQVRREVERAVSKEMPIIPFRIQNTKPTRALEYSLSNTHWFDAFDPPLERHVARLEAIVRQFLASDGGKVPASSPQNQARQVEQPANRRNLGPWIVIAAVLLLVAGVKFLGSRPKGGETSPAGISDGKSGTAADVSGKDFIGRWTFLHDANRVQTNFGNDWMSVTTYSEDWITIGRSPTNGLIVTGTKTASQTDTLTGVAAGSVTTYNSDFPPGSVSSCRHFLSNGRTTIEESNHNPFLLQSAFSPEKNWLVLTRESQLSGQAQSRFTNTMIYALDKTKTKLVQVVFGGRIRTKYGLPVKLPAPFAISNEVQITPELVEQLVEWDGRPHTNSNRPGSLNASTYAVRVAP